MRSWSWTPSCRWRCRNLRTFDFKLNLNVTLKKSSTNKLKRQFLASKSARKDGFKKRNNFNKRLKMLSKPEISRKITNAWKEERRKRLRMRLRGSRKPSKTRTPIRKTWKSLETFCSNNKKSVFLPQEKQNDALQKFLCTRNRLRKPSKIQSDINLKCHRLRSIIWNLRVSVSKTLIKALIITVIWWRTNMSESCKTWKIVAQMK